MLLLSNMVLNTGTVSSFDHLPFSAVSLTHKNCGLIFCFAKPLTGNAVRRFCWIATKFWYPVAKLRLEFFVNFEPCTVTRGWLKQCHTFLPQFYHVHLSSRSSIIFNKLLLFNFIPDTAGQEMNSTTFLCYIFFFQSKEPS